MYYTHAIPFACLAQLGGLQPTDPAVVIDSLPGHAEIPTALMGGDEVPDGAWVLLPQSEDAVVQVVGRHLNPLKVKQQQQDRYRWRRSRLRPELTGAGHYLGWVVKGGGQVVYCTHTHLSDTDRDLALAQLVVHLARIARLREPGWEQIRDTPNGSLTLDTLAHGEQLYGFPRWEVRTATPEAPPAPVPLRGACRVRWGGRTWWVAYIHADGDAYLIEAQRSDGAILAGLTRQLELDTVHRSTWVPVKDLELLGEESPCER